MAGSGPELDRGHYSLEGRTCLDVDPSGGLKGPATRGGVFFNPAMVQNRDLSVIFLQYLSDNDLLVGKNRRILDGLCGSGARAVRIAKETDLIDQGTLIIGTDINPISIKSAKRNSKLNDVDIDLIETDLNQFLVKGRFSYIDIDPFGTPVPFIQSAVQGVLNGGIIAVTATDTAALTGSIARVAWRRYGIQVKMTHAYQEIACRSLMGYIARTASTFDRGVEPLFFYTSDHFIRGYVRIRKGAKRADLSLENVAWIDHAFPGPPLKIVHGLDSGTKVEGSLMGPIWVGPLENKETCLDLIGMVEDDDRWGYLQSISQIRSMLERSITENDLPLLGYDVNEFSSHLKISPPSMNTILEGLTMIGRRMSRSRFSPTIFKTDASYPEVINIFNGGDD